jgi:hypothetical protein
MTRRCWTPCPRASGTPWSNTWPTTSSAAYNMEGENEVTYFRIVQGDVMDLASVEKAVQGQERAVDRLSPIKL